MHAWAKYGADAFEFFILLLWAPKDLIFYEQWALDAYDAARTGYNILPTAGNSAGAIASLETRAKQRAAKLGKKLTPEHIEKARLASLGRKYPGYVLTEERKAKCRERRHTDEAKAKIGAASKGNKPKPSPPRSSAARRERSLCCRWSRTNKAA